MLLFRFLPLLFLLHLPVWADDNDSFFTDDVDAMEVKTTEAAIAHSSSLTPEKTEAAAEPLADDFSTTSTIAPDASNDEAQATADDFLEPSEVESSAVNDEVKVLDESSDTGLERYNRATFRFNDGVDHYFLKPVSQGYRWITPNIIDNGITRIFSNIGEVPTTINALLQAKPKVAGKATLRLLINSTVGLLGFFDVATKWGIDGQDEDFAQTLAVWGVPTGPYIQLPFLGPSTLRNAPSRIVDAIFDPLNQIDHTETYIAVKVVDVVDSRADFLDAEKLITGDRYEFIKTAYLQRRHYVELDGHIEDNFDQSMDSSDDWMNE